METGNVTLVTLRHEAQKQPPRVSKVRQLGLDIEAAQASAPAALLPGKSQIFYIVNWPTLLRPLVWFCSALDTIWLASLDTTN